MRAVEISFPRCSHPLKIATDISLLARSVNEMSQLVDRIGTNVDNSTLRERLFTLRSRAKETIAFIGANLKKPFDRSMKPKHDRLAKQFGDTVAHYETVARKSLRREREVALSVADRMEKRKSGFSVGMQGARTGEGSEALRMDELLHARESRNGNRGDVQSLAQVQREEPSFEELNAVDNRIIEDMNEDIRYLEQDLAQLADVFADMSEIVGTQGQDLDEIHKDMDSADVRVTEGVVELKEADYYQRASRKKILIICGIIFVIVAIVAAVLAVHFTKKN